MKKISILALCVLGLSLCANSANFGGKKFYLKSASNLNGNLNCSKELEHYAS